MIALRTNSPRALGLYLRMFRGGGRSDRGLWALAVGAAALVVLVLTLTLGVLGAIDARQDRTGWQVPQASADAVAQQMTRTRIVDGMPFTTVYLAARAGVPAESLPAVPGVGRFPRPGEVFAAPRVTALGPERSGLAPPSATIALTALRSPDQQVAVVGLRPGDPRLAQRLGTDALRPGEQVDATPISGFRAGSGGEQVTSDGGLRFLAGAAAILLIVPVLALASAVAQLGAHRRNRRAAALRLAGAPRHAVSTIAVAEAVTIGTAGVVAGGAAVAVLAPAMSRVELDASTWMTWDLWPGWPIFIGMWAVLVTALAVASIYSSRRAVIDPVAVADAHTPRPLRLVRVVAFVAVLIGFAEVTRGESGASQTVLLVAFGTVFAATLVIGPWLVQAVGWRLIRRGASDPVALIAGRRVVDDPRAGWRLVAGVALACFVAGFFASFGVGDTTVFRGTSGAVDVMAPEGEGGRVRAAVDAAVTQSVGAGVAAVTVEAIAPPAYVLIDPGAGNRGGSVGMRTETVRVALPVDPAARDKVRDAIARAVPELPAATGAENGARSNQLLVDMRRSVFIVLGVAFLTAAVSVGVTSAAGILERRDTFRAQRLAGVPLTVLDRSRRRALMSPMVATSLTAGLAGIFSGAPLAIAGGGGYSLSGLLLVVLAFGSGWAVTEVATRASSPLLARVSAP
ncbi:FtsX-like permease family protein [Tsukamurella strandjordii]|uniref:ABC3 transporter permease C-terminal domain-containing protein n=1 Tax=Tsukamurella strandjordii TaxID=147577 RepID=A0AA90N961_9ACTN|nr:FtsX-like permease family protein [Tsukamurella strandjordii]MDP0396297.1 hypothetical protein [Tsukamurella strandjordii]